MPASHAGSATAVKPAGANKTQAIPWDQIGAKAGADYHGDGLNVIAGGNGARLHCVFQRLEGEATSEGLWLASTVTNPPGDRFRVVAVAVGGQSLSPQGTVTVDGQTVRFTRAGLVEEYSVSLDGVRQDFVVTEKPAGDCQLQVRLAVGGARVEPAANGAQLVLERSGRKIAYSRLHAAHANGKELPARIEAAGDVAASRESAAENTSSAGCGRTSTWHLPSRGYGELVVIVNDAGAVYPIRIDPTFSDANWVGMGGVNVVVEALAVSGTNLYVGGLFSTAGGNPANNIAQWNGSNSFTSIRLPEIWTPAVLYEEPAEVD